MNEKKKYKHLVIDPEIHFKFKVYSVKKEKDMTEIVEELILEKMESDPID